MSADTKLARWTEAQTREQMQAKFDAFHAANPHIWALFLKFTREALLSKRKRFGARMIWERMRWYTTIEAKTSGDYRLNDHWPPFYARLFVQTYPQYEGFFQLRDGAKT